MSNNRIHNSSNPFQGDYKRVLCVCSAGLLRSPSAALVLSTAPFNYNVRAAGLSDDYALVLVSKVLLHWANEVVCMTSAQKRIIEQKLNKQGLKTKVICLDIDDNYRYRDPALMQLIAERYRDRSK